MPDDGDRKNRVRRAATALLCAVALSLDSCGGGGGGGTGSATSSAAQGPVARFVYVANDADNTVSIYSVGADGMLRNRGYALAGKVPISVNVDPSNRFAYVANFGDGRVSGFQIDADTGALAPVPNSPFNAEATPQGPASVAMDPSGKFLYVADNASAKVAGFQILGTGELTPVAGSPFSTGGSASTSIAVDPSGKFVYVANTGSGDISGFSIDPASGTLKAIVNTQAQPNFPSGAPGPFSPSAGPFSIAIDSQGKFVYVANSDSSNSVSVFGIDPGTGALTGVAGSPFPTGGTNPQSVALDPLGRFAYVANTLSNSISAFKIANGALTLVNSQTQPATTAPASLAVDPTGQFVYVANFGTDNMTIYAIKQDSGDLSSIGTRLARSAPRAVAVAKGANAVADTPTFAYVTNQFDNSLSGFTVDATTGALGQIDADSGTTGVQNYAIGSLPTSVAADPAGRFVYSPDAAGVSAFSLQAGTGALRQVQGSPFPYPASTLLVSAGVVDSAFIAVEPSGRFAYATHFFLYGFSIAQDTGALAPVPGTPVPVTTRQDMDLTSIAIDPSGRFVYVAFQTDLDMLQIAGFAIEPVHGGLTPIAGSPLTVSSGREGKRSSLAIDPSGQFAYLAFEGTGTTRGLTIDPVSGALDFNSLGVTVQEATGISPLSLAIDPLGKFMYFAEAGPDFFNPIVNNVSAFTIGPTGVLNSAGQTLPTGGSGLNFVCVDPLGRFVYAANADSTSITRFPVNADGSLGLPSNLPYVGNRPTSIAIVGTTR